MGHRAGLASRARRRPGRENRREIRRWPRRRPAAPVCRRPAYLCRPVLWSRPPGAVCHVDGVPRAFRDGGERVPAHLSARARISRAISRAISRIARARSRRISQVLELSWHAQSAATRRRFRNLAHLPLGARFGVAEIDVAEVVSEEVLGEFGAEIAKRAERRRAAAKAEAKAEEARARDERERRRRTGRRGAGQLDGARAVWPRVTHVCVVHVAGRRSRRSSRAWRSRLRRAT